MGEGPPGRERKKREGKGEEGMEGEGAGEGKEEKGRGRAIPQNENPGFGWRGGLVVGRRTCDLVVAGSRPGRDAAA